MNPVMKSLTATKYHMAQYNTFRDPEKCLNLQRWIIKEKLDFKIRFLILTENQEKNTEIRQLEKIRQDIENGFQKFTNQRHLESTLAKYAKLTPEKFGFYSGNQSFIRSSKNNAANIIMLIELWLFYPCRRDVKIH